MRHALLTSVTAPTTGDDALTDLIFSGGWAGNATFDAEVKGSGAVTATVVIEVTNGGEFKTIGTIGLSGTDSATDGFVIHAKWHSVRARLTAISGSGAYVKCFVSG